MPNYLNRKIAVKKTDGSVAIVILTSEATEATILKDCQSVPGYKSHREILDGEQLPTTRFRDCWVDDGSNILIDFIKATTVLIRDIKQEASRRIVAAYPEWRQRNHMAAVADIQNKELVALKANTTYTLSADELTIIAAAQAAKTEIFNIRAKSDELEASLDSMTQAQLEAFNPTNDSNWI